MSDSKGLPAVTCVVLNWNGWKDTFVCLDALATSSYPKLRIIVVDNASTDDSVVNIRRQYPAIKLMEAGGNLGFGGGNNVGIRAALLGGSDYIWLLNNDASPTPDALSELIAKAEADGSLGAVGSVLMYAHDHAKVQAWGGGRVNRWVGRTVHATLPKADHWFHYITAASVLIRSEALRTSGLFDERFFLYWEDVDLGVRFRQSGWRLGVASQSVVLHKEGSSTEGNFKARDRYSTTSGIRFLRKHSPMPAFAIPFYLAARLLRRLVSGDIERVGAVSDGIRDYFMLRTK